MREHGQETLMFHKPRRVFEMQKTIEKCQKMKMDLYVNIIDRK